MSQFNELKQAQSVLDILALKRIDEAVKQYNYSEKKPVNKHEDDLDQRDSIHVPARISVQQKKLKVPEKPVQSRILVDSSPKDREQQRLSSRPIEEVKSFVPPV